LTQIHDTREEEDFESSVTSVNACIESVGAFSSIIELLTVIKKFPKWPTLVCSTRLRTVYRVEGLVEEEADCPTCIYPRWAVHVKSRVVPEEGQAVDNHKAEAGESDLVGCQRMLNWQMDMLVPDSACEDNVSVANRKRSNR